MKRLLTILIMGALFAGCSALTGGDDAKPKADAYNVYQLGDQYPVTIKYWVDGDWTTVEVDSATVNADSYNPSLMSFDAKDEANPKIQIINSGSNSITLNATITNDNMARAIGTAGGPLDPGEQFTVKRGTLSR